MATVGLSLPRSLLASAVGHALFFGGMMLVIHALRPAPRLAIEVEWAGATAAPGPASATPQKGARKKSGKKSNVSPQFSFDLTQEVSADEDAGGEQGVDGAAAGSPGGAVSMARVSRLPRRLTEVKARYPDEARKLGLEGKVVMILAISAEGRVTDARVVEKAGHGFDEEAVAAVMRFIFSPAYVGDKPVAVEIRYTYVFELR